MKKLNFYDLFFIFLAGCVLGWCIEGIWTYLTTGNLVNHSAVAIGPFNFAYGVCACCFTILLFRFRNASYFKVFMVSFFGGTVLEYFMSLGMELVLGFTAWDYSNEFLNINGRVCLLFSFFWGILGLLWIKLIFPHLEKYLEKIGKKTKKIVSISLLIFLILDVIFTYGAIMRARDCEKGIEAKNSYERFLDKTFNKKFLKNMFNNNWE